MATYVPSKRATALTFYLSLVSQANANIFQANPTLAAGDVKVSTDGGAEANITTLPVVTPAGSKRIKVDLSVSEMTGDNIQVTFSDVAGAEWADLTVNIPTAGYQFDDLHADVVAVAGTITSQHGSGSYVEIAPDNAGIAAIKLQTDKLNFTGTDVKATLDGETVQLSAITHTGAVIPRVTLNDTTTANTDMRGTDGAALASNYNATRAGYLDNLNVGGLVASQADVQNIQKNTFITTNIPMMLERPDTGSVSIEIVVVFSDETGTAKDIDAAANPTITLVNNAGTSLSSRLSAWTHPSTGEYHITYTNSAADAIDDLHWMISATLNAKLRKMPALTQIVDTTAIDFTSADRADLQAVKDATTDLKNIAPNQDT